MLTKLELLVEYNYTEKLSYQISSLMHGILMEVVDWEYGEVLHQNGRKPFQQYISKMTDHSFVWTICTLNDKAREQIIDRLAQKQSFYMKHKNLQLQVKEKHIVETTYERLIEKYYFTEQERNIKIRFLTPTAFKSQGKYVFIPTPKFIFQSLMNKYDAFSNETKVSDKETLEHFEQNIFIKKYQLKSVRYALEGVWISAFLGEVTLYVKGPEQLVNLANMLAAFGEYAGIGIKCSLGMGAIQTKEAKANE